MKIFGYAIKRNSSLTENPLSLVFICLMVGTFAMATINSGYFASYRLGNSIIPGQSELVRSGPYSMNLVETRNDTLIHFSPLYGGMEYSQSLADFDDSQNLRSIVAHNNGQSNIFLYLYPNNPIMQIWGVDLNGRPLLSYERALFIYQIQSSPKWMLEATILNLILFMLSIVNIARVNDGALTKKEK